MLTLTSMLREKSKIQTNTKRNQTETKKHTKQQNSKIFQEQQQQQEQNVFKDE